MWVNESASSREVNPGAPVSQADGARGLRFGLGRTRAAGVPADDAPFNTERNLWFALGNA